MIGPRAHNPLGPADRSRPKPAKALAASAHLGFWHIAYLRHTSAYRPLQNFTVHEKADVDPGADIA